MADDDVQYKYQSVKVIRGREASTIAKMQNDGWELESQNTGTLRTEMTFRRVTTPTKTPWLLLAAILGVGVLLLAIGGIIEAVQGGDDAPSATDTPSATAATPSEEPSEEATPTPPEEPSEEPSETASTPTEVPSEEPTETQPTEPATDEVLTVDNNQDLKTLLTSGEDYALSKAFAKTYEGRKIEFDGNVASAASHNGASTRFDFLIYAGDYSDTVANPGPSFQLRDVNFYDLNLQGRGSGVGMEDNLHIVAEVGEFEPRTGLFLLKPVSTRLR